jgi:hypothetical protein
MLSRAMTYLRSEQGRPMLYVIALGGTIESFVYVNGYLAKRRQIKKNEAINTDPEESK